MVEAVARAQLPAYVDARHLPLARLSGMAFFPLSLPLPPRKTSVGDGPLSASFAIARV
jgi:hypothetical protein